MKTTTIISYTFFYKDGEPWFYNMSISIFKGSEMLFHDAGATIEDSHYFQQAHDKVLAEKFEEGLTMDGTLDEVKSTSFTKMIEG